MTSRRTFLALASAGLACSRLPERPADAVPPDMALIQSVERSVIWNGRRDGNTWFHPRPCRLPGGRLLMAVQNISGSDNFSDVHWSESTDGGRAWSDPVPVPGFERRPIEEGLEEAVADTVPEHHPPSDTTLWIGWNVYYKDDELTRPNERRWPVYIVRRADGTWSDRAKLAWDHPAAARIYGCNCSQRVTREDGKILIPMTFASYEREDRQVGSVLCAFDGERLEVEQTGNALDLAVKRGLLEPSLTRFGDRYLMTIRAEDGRGYVSRSDDGLEWAPIRAWAWDDGEPLTMSTTQQHWLPHGDALYLVYTRETADNAGVMRWRSPLLAARVDPEKLCLFRETETTVFPMSEEDRRSPADAARLGNFHTVSLSPQESLVTVGEARPNQDWAGDTLQARIRWGVLA